MESIIETFYNGPTLSVTISREGSRIHRLIDDICQPLRANKTIVRRDPMVEALFGAASPRTPMAAVASPGRKR
ncbi:hypothetical protein GTP81_06725 [Rugamonas sp. FT107W]|uniref:Uncharacterized protein n=1 Tax=Duganella vulcania TaxID=2692166 RepID=A0A845HHP8_9BURK|nr:hypothetical protein [Duganella vulcania]MYN16444.1 hypothetical protein [Duganella vulcania]